MLPCKKAGVTSLHSSPLAIDGLCCTATGEQCLAREDLVMPKVLATELRFEMLAYLDTPDVQLLFCKK